MKKQIAYIEIDTHAEIAENFAELTKNSEKFSVDFYFSKKILSRLNSSEIENIIETEPENLLEKLKGKSYGAPLFSYFQKNHGEIRCGDYLS